MQRITTLNVTYCEKNISGLYKHFQTKSCGYSNFYLEEWSRAFMEAPTDNTTEEFENFVNKDRGEYSVYLVRSGPTLKHLVYVGITAIKDLKYRFSDHGHIDKFSNYKNLQRAVFLPKMSKTTAEIVEPLIIMSSKTNKKMLNTRKEVRNLNQLDVPDEPFHERVMRYHKMVVNLLARRWEELKWEDFSAEQQPTSSSSIQITTTPNIQQCKRRSNQELLEELEAKDKVIEEQNKKLKIADTKILIAKTESFFHHERALKIR
ncbi:hypothetical protein ACQ4LE_005497, partial [Meloidogyne hapla]